NSPIELLPSEGVRSRRVPDAFNVLTLSDGMRAAGNEAQKLGHRQAGRHLQPDVRLCCFSGDRRIDRRRAWGRPMGNSSEAEDSSSPNETFFAWGCAFSTRGNSRCEQKMPDANRGEKMS